MHRSERADPTTRSWTPPRTFLAQVRFLRSGENHPVRGLRRPPPDRKTPGRKRKKTALRASFPDGPEGRPAAPRQHRRKRPGGRTDQALRRAGKRPRKQAPRPSESTGNGSPASLKTLLKIPRHTPAPARQTVSPARAEDLVQDLQPTAGARRRTLPQRRGPSQNPDAGGSHTPSRGREKGNVPASPRFADQLREEESNSQQPAPPEGRSSESSDQ